MATSPLITFKAGRCDQTGRRVTPIPTPGYIYLYLDDDLPHFCWRPRSAPSTEPELDLIMFPGDGTFKPLLKEHGTEDLHSPTTGRIYELSFSSSSQKHFFWMQSKTQHREGNLSWFSQRDQRLGQIVDLLLQGEEVDVQREMEDVRDGDGGGDAGDDAEAMDLDRQESQTGGAGADATGGDPRDEGEASREGGEDGGRAASSSNANPSDTNALVQNFLASLNQGGAGRSQADKPFTTLPDLLTTGTTIPFISTASSSTIDTLCAFLPPELFLLSQYSASDPSSLDPDPTPAAAQAAIEALSTEQKKEVLRRVLHSPQLRQSLGSLTEALRDGGLPMIGEALGLKVQNGGLMRGASMPLGGGEAVEAFVDGVKRTVEDGKLSEEDPKGD